MMRYSEIPRDFSSDSLRFVEYGEEYIYQNFRDESPPSDISSHDGPLLRNSNSNNDEQNDELTKHKQFHDNEYEKHQHCQHQENIGCSNKHRKDSTKSVGGSSTESSSYTRHKNSENHNNSKGSKTSKSRKNSIGSACINALSSSPNSGCYQSHRTTSSSYSKTQSLPANTSIKDYDTIILNALRVSPDELANQITLLDFPIFAAIQPDELTSCAWTKKDKYSQTPNIVAFTKRFNHTSFWTVQEILSSENHKERGEILTHFIKVAKKLFELNNLHSLFAILSGMQSASVHRLKKTWSCISKKDKQNFERLTNVFNDDNNWKNLRDYLDSLKLPCIPYLGLFLTDLIYIDIAHPHKGGLEPEQRRNKMNNILRIISNYQQSNYTHIKPNDRILNYLKSIRYIEELQNIFEEDQYKRSLKLEPSSTSSSSSTSVPNSTSYNSNRESFNVDIPSLACLNLSPAKTVGSVRLTKSAGTKFIPTHRKCRSLGSKFRSTSLPRNFSQKCNCPIMMITPGIGTISNKRNCKCRIFCKINPHQNTQNYAVSGLNNHQHHYYYHNHHQTLDNNDEVIVQSRHLLDDSVLEDVNSIGQQQNHHQQNYQYQLHQQQQHTLTSSDTISLESCDGAALCNYESDYYTDTTTIIAPSSSASKMKTSLSSSSLNSNISGTLSASPITTSLLLLNNLQGCVRRKTLLKDGRKPAVASWQRYWLQIWSNSLVYYPPKSFKGTERCDFKREPCKVCPLNGWSAHVLDVNNSKNKNSFELFNTQIGTVYKFRTDCERITVLWTKAICNAAIGTTTAHGNSPVPVNLMSFE